eukprot:579337-Karenia_brevis.AAC.1
MFVLTLASGFSNYVRDLNNFISLSAASMPWIGRPWVSSVPGCAHRGAGIGNFWKFVEPSSG